MSEVVAAVRDLTITFGAEPALVYALHHVAFDLVRGRITGIVGESGSGKSTLGLALIGLLPDGARIVSGSMKLAGTELVGLPERRLRELRGSAAAMVFQDPMTSLNPARSVGGHLRDAQYRDRGQGRAALELRAVEMLKKVGVPDAVAIMSRHPHQLSGGMRQRIAIAMALLGRPELLIADEPTTALDVTMEAQILHLLRELRKEVDGAIVFISHNLGAVAEICDHVVVLYAGEVVEEGPVRTIFHDPRHPYTRALLDCDPARIGEMQRPLPSIPGDIPVVSREPQHCIFVSRCTRATDLCRSSVPQWMKLGDERGARCHYAGDPT